MILNKETQKLVNKVALEMDIPHHIASVAYLHFWLFIKTKISELPDLRSIKEEDFNSLRVNFNIPSLGKFTTNMQKIRKINKFKEIIDERTKHKKRKGIT